MYLEKRKLSVGSSGGRSFYFNFSSVGALVAFCMSYTVNSSVCWGILHFFMSWIYVVYWLFSYTHFKQWMLQWVVQ